MSIETAFGNFFKTESKASGRKLVAEEKVTLASGSDTTILAYVRATPPIRVFLASAGVNQPFGDMRRVKVLSLSEPNSFDVGVHVLLGIGGLLYWASQYLL